MNPHPFVSGVVAGIALAVLARRVWHDLGRTLDQIAPRRPSPAELAARFSARQEPVAARPDADPAPPDSS